MNRSFSIMLLAMFLIIPNGVQVLAGGIDFNGDLRLRYERQSEEGSEVRQRARFRLRLGGTAEVNNRVKTGFGFASGSDSPTSTNQTLENNFDSPDTRIDYVYVQYSPVAWAKIYGGKFKRSVVIWQASDLLWDSDINPEGAAVSLNQNSNGAVNFFSNIGFFILDESSSDASDPIMYTFQPGCVWKIGGNTTLKTAVVYYGFNGVKGDVLEHSSGSNTSAGLDTTGAPDGIYKYNYNSLNPSIEIGITNTLVGYFALFSEYITNSDPSDNNTGYLYGFKFGDESVKEKNQWQISYSYKKLEKDAWLDVFNNGSFHGGETDVKGHKASFSLGLAKNIDCGVTYFSTKNMSGAITPENITQVNLSLAY